MEFATFGEIFQMIGVKTKKVGADEVKVICPECGEKTFQASLTRGYGKCWKCDTRFNYISYYAAVYGIDNKQATKEIIEHTGRQQCDFFSSAASKKEAPLAPIEVRNSTYGLLLEKLPLSKRHLTDMVGRGFSQEEVKRLRYRTYNCGYKSDRKKLASSIVKKGASVKDVPGFYTENNSPIVCWRKNGILVPYRDRHNMIQGFQIRKNQELLELDEDGKPENKYDWFSSNGKTDGTPSLSYTHYACDFIYDFETGKEFPVLAKEVMLTEGAMKGDICHFLSGKPMLAIAGVQCTELLEKELPYLKKNGVERILDCFDMDYISNPQIEKASLKLKKMIENAGLEYVRNIWNPNYKGYDDYLYHIKKEGK